MKSERKSFASLQRILWLFSKKEEEVNIMVTDLLIMLENGAINTIYSGLFKTVLVTKG